MVVVMTQQLGPTIRSALSDESEYVRSSAADTFEMLHNKLGVQAIEEIIPHLLDLLQASEEEKARALDGLRRILAAKGRAVLPAVLPKLTQNPSILLLWHFWHQLQENIFQDMLIKSWRLSLIRLLIMNAHKGIISNHFPYHKIFRG